MPRQYIGPKVDFRIPEEVEAQIREWADGDGETHDGLCRDLLLRGFVTEQRRRARGSVARVSGQAE